MEELKDINGLPFKGGCSFEDKNHNICEVLKVREEELLYCCPARDVTGKYPKYMLVQDKCRILNYRELAPDKNGKMLCEGDTVRGVCGTYKVITSIEPSTFIVESSGNNGWDWVSAEMVTFVSRPTDVPTEAAKKKAEIQEQIKKLEADVAELKRKAEGM